MEYIHSLPVNLRLSLLPGFKPKKEVKTTGQGEISLEAQVCYSFYILNKVYKYTCSFQQFYELEFFSVSHVCVTFNGITNYTTKIALI